MWPEFYLLDETSKSWSQNELLGTWSIIYIYPKDDTPGCTRQACEMSSKQEEWKLKGVQIIGVSADNAQSHQKFKARYNIQFPLLIDDQLQLMRALGVWKLKSMYGKNYWGAERSAFLVNPKGEIVWSEQPVKLEGHLQRLEQAVEEHLLNKTGLRPKRH
jgi:peroxiredoxin Q/BCP